MRKFFALVAFVCTCHIALSQQDFEAFDRQLEEATSDTARSRMLFRLYRGLSNTNPDSAVKIFLLHKAHFEKNENQQGIAWMLHKLGGAFIKTGDHQKSASLGLEALKHFEQIRDTFGILNALNVTGISINNNGDPKTAIGYYKNLLQYNRLFKDERLNASARNNIADCFLNLNLPDSALPYLAANMEYSVQTNDPYALGIAFANYGTYYRQKKNHEMSLLHLKQAIPHVIEANDLYGYAETDNLIAEVYFLNKQYDSSLKYAFHSVQLSKEGGFNESMMEGYTWLYKNYEMKNMGDSAFKYLKLSTVTKDSLFNEEKARNIQGIAFSEQLRQEEIATKVAIDARKRKDNLQLLIIAISILMLFFAVILLGKMHVKPATVEFTGLLALLLLFEFINILLHPLIGTVTHHKPLYMLIIMACIAALLIPTHHKLTYWIKNTIAKNSTKRKHKYTRRRVSPS